MSYAYKLLRVVVLLLWPPAILAATMVTLESTLAEVSAGSWAIVLGLATMGGLTSLLHRLRTELPDSIAVYVSSHMLMAWFSGAMSFFLMEVMAMNDFIEIPLIGVAAYAGARLVDPVTERVALWFEERVAKLLE